MKYPVKFLNADRITIDPPSKLVSISNFISINKFQSSTFTVTVFYRPISKIL
jgi:hypothetical protein